MFRVAIVQQSKNLKNFIGVYQSTKRLIQCGTTVPHHSPKDTSAALLLAQPKQPTNTYSETIRNYSKSAALCFYNSPSLYSDQEEEVGCTITPCCRPFRLQTEHPMKNIKPQKTEADKCEKKEKKTEPPPPPPPPPPKK